jgi:predicted transcriptional regulator
MTPSELLAVRAKIGSSLRNKREILDMTIKQLADHSGLGWYTISRIEGGLKDYRLDSLVILSKALKELYFKKKFLNKKAE